MIQFRIGIDCIAFTFVWIVIFPDLWYLENVIKMVEEVCDDRKCNAFRRI